jgi:rubredoxin
MNKWHCANCGYRYDGENPPDIRPECRAIRKDIYPTYDTLLNANIIR